MSIIPKSPSENLEQKKAPSVPQKTRGLFPRDDGWYDVDENGGEKKLATMDDIPNDNNPSVIKNISISKSEDYTNLSIEKQDGTTLNEEFYNKDQANTKFAIKSDIPDVTVLTQEVANIEKKKVDILDIVDDLNTYDSSKPLSANMGALLYYDKVSRNDIVDDLLTYDSSKPLSANMGALLYSGIPDLVSQAVAGLNLMDYNAVDNLIYNHNVDSTNHSDIRYEIQQIANRLTAFLDTDDTTLDQVSEIVAYINSNKELIDAITTSKVNVVDIVDDLQTSSSDRPLSANQGVQLMSMLNNLALDLYAFLDNTSDGNMYPLSNLIQQIDRRVAYDDIVYDSFDNIPMYNNGGIYNPLSANLGYQLYQNKIGFDKIVTDPSIMWQEDGTLVLSAYYGKILNDYIYNVEQSVPYNMSELYNDCYYVYDPYYVHTTNDFTDNYKNILDNYQLIDDLTYIPSSTDYSYSYYPLSARIGKYLEEYINSVAQSIPYNISQLYNDLGYAYISDIPYNMSQLNNDNYYVQDPYYVHTTNDFADNYKNILDNYEVIDDLNNISSFDYSYSYKLLSARVGKYLEEFISSVAQSIPFNISQLYNDSGYAYSSDIPYNMSQLNNDSYYIVDSSYVHTDNNFTDEYKEKLDNLGENTEGGSGSGGITHSWNGTVLTITSDSGTSSVDLKGDKGDAPNVVFHYDEETGELSYKVDGTLVDGDYVATNDLASKEYVDAAIQGSGNGFASGSFWLQPFELMGTATLQEDCTRWIITQTDDGVTFDDKQYRAIKFITKTTPSADTTANNANGFVWINHAGGGASLTGVNMLHSNATRTQTFYGEVVNGYAYYKQLGITTSNGMERLVALSTNPKDYVSKIIIDVVTSGHKYGAGSTVEIWGCK